MFRRTIIVLVVLAQSLPLMVSGAESRVITVSTVCLLEGEPYRNAEYALSVVEEACTRLPNDLVVTPLMPFVSFQEGSEAADLSAFAKLAKARSYLPCCCS